MVLCVTTFCLEYYVKFLYCMREVTGSVLYLETNLPELRFSLFYYIPPDKCRYALDSSVSAASSSV